MMRDQGQSADAAFSMIGDSLTIGGSGGQASPSGTADAIRIRTTSTDQFGTACFIKFELDDPSGETFTAYAPVAAHSNGQAVSQVIGSGPLVMEIVTTGNYGAAYQNAMFGAACDRLSIDVGQVQCRMGAPAGGPLVDCPRPVMIDDDNSLAALRLITNADASAATNPRSTDKSGMDDADADIPINLEGRDPQEVMRWLFEQR
jgi:hypothetical protein